jgi:hypothetical protein
MATVKSQYLYWNGSTWDKYYFESSIDMVIGLQTILDEKTGKTYIASRGQNLLTNGTALLGNNTNFSSFIFDGAHANNSPGSFRYTGAATLFNDEFMPVEATKRYKMSIDAKTLNGVGRYYMMTVCFDVDGNFVNANTHMFRANTLTTLAQELKNGDTIVYLNSAANWDNSGTAGVNTHLRSIIIWNYVNSFGYLYPPLTYSRNWTGNAWDPGAINFTNNTITLRVAWAGGTIPAGTPLSNGSSGGSYKYNVMGNTLLTTDWVTYTGIMDGMDFSGTNVSTKFPPGTAKIKIGWLMNYSGSGETAWFTNMTVSLDYQYRTELADKLTTARQINGINFDGSSNITIYDSTKFPSIGGVLSGGFNVNDQGDGATGGYSMVLRSSTDREYLFGGGENINAISDYIRIGVNKLQFHTNSNIYSIYHSGNKPSPDDIGAMPKIGGAFTGPVSFNDNITSDGGYILFTGLDSINFGGAVLANVSDPYYAQDAATKNYVDSLGLGDLFNVAISSPGTDHAIVWNGTSWANTAINKTFIGLSSVENYGIATQAEAEAGTSGLKYMTPQRTEQAIRKRSIAQVITRTVSATLALTDENDFVYVNSSSALTFTIPPNSSVAFPVGTEIHFMRYGTGEVSLAPGSGVTLLSDGTKRRINTQYQVVTIKKILTDTWVLFGAIKT